MKPVITLLLAIIALLFAHTQVNACDLDPTAVITLYPEDTVFFAGEQVFFNGYNSTANCGYISNYRWQFDGVTVNTSALYGPSFSLQSGQDSKTVDVQLRVQNSVGNYGYKTVTITIVREHSSYYYLTDHLGSVRVTVDDDGNSVGWDDYYPFGLQMPGRTQNASNPNDDTKFTGYLLEQDGDLGPYHAEARMYDPVIGRFMQVDPLADDPMQVHLTPYNYAWNNPVLLNDPSGECPVCLVVWGVAELGLAIYDAYDAGSTLMDPNASSTEKIISGGGFVAGAILPGGGYSAADNVVEGGGKLISKFSSKSVDEASGLIGKEFEQFLGKSLVGITNVKYSGREFDVETATSLIEAKSGGYWDLITNEPDLLLNFKSTLPQQAQIAAEQSKNFELISNTSIPAHIKDWLNKKGINYSEVIDQ